MSEKEEGFFQIPYQRVSRDDVRSRLEKDVNQISDAALSDEFMGNVVEKMGNVLVDEGWWDVLGDAIDEVCDELDIDFKKGVKCTLCGAFNTVWSSTTTFENQNIKKVTKTFYCDACGENFDIEV